MEDIMNSKHIITPICIDMGAENNGIYSTKIDVEANKFAIDEIYHTGKCIVFDKGKITFMQKNRTEKRHQSRGMKRRKLAKRLLLSLFRYYNIDEKTYRFEIEFIQGIFNRRGYTFISEVLDESLYDKEVSDYLLNHLREKNISIAESYKTILDFFMYGFRALDIKNIKIIRDCFSEDDFLGTFKTKCEKEDSKAHEKIVKNINEYSNKIIDEIKLGAKHRTIFLEDIKHDIEEIHNGHSINGRVLQITKLLEAMNMSVGEFTNLIGNICNLQLRVLRKYFNDETLKTNDTWRYEKCITFVRKWIVSWHCKRDDEKTNKKRLLEELKILLDDKKQHNESHDIAIQWLMNTEAKYTIPPYEDQLNRNIPKCKSLYLNPTALDEKFPAWMESVAILSNVLGEDCKKNIEIRNPKINKVCIDEHKEKENRYKNAIILQRILDKSKRIDIFDIRATVRFYNNSTEKTERPIGAKKLEDLLKGDSFINFINFAKYYYQSIEEARVGIWDNPEQDIKKARKNIFRICNTNPPHKNKFMHTHINNLISGCSLTAEDVDIDTGKAYEFWSDEHMIGGKKSYKKFAEQIEEQRKKRGNRFKWDIQYAIYLDKNKREKEIDTDITKLLNVYAKNPCLYEKFIKRLKGEEDTPDTQADKKLLDEKIIIPSMYIFSQIYNILEKERQGFSKNCKYCIQENTWRSEECKDENNNPLAKATRLSVDSVRPFDGFLGRYIEYLATEIFIFKKNEIERMSKQASINNIYIPIIIEQNSFDFEESLTKLKDKKEDKNKKSKKIQKQGERIKSKKERIKTDNEYCPYCDKKFTGGQIDHIIPRAFSQKHFKTTFNSEANLIYCCSDCNQSKNDTMEKLLDKIGDNHLEKAFETSDRGTIKKNIEDNIDTILRYFRTYILLSEEDQKYIKYGLFMPEIRKKIIPVLHLRNKTMVNGTQAYLVKLIRKKILDYAQEKKIVIETHPFLIQATDESFNMYGHSADKKNKQLLIQSDSMLATRKILSLVFGGFEKQKTQSYLSHVIDATMIFGTVLRSGDILHKVLSKDIFLNYADIGEVMGDALKNDDFNTAQTLKSLIPDNNSISHIKRQENVEGRHYWERSRFGDSIYAEVYYPLILSQEGILYYGYIDPKTKKEFLEKLEKGSKKQSTNENAYTLLAPFLKNKKLSTLDDEQNIVPFEDVLEHMKKQDKKHLFFSWDKQKIGAYFQKMFYEKDMFQLEEESDKKIIKYLEKLRKICKKKSIVDIDVLDKDGRTRKNYSVYAHETLLSDKAQKILEMLKEAWKKNKEVQNFFEKEKCFNQPTKDKDIKDKMKKANIQSPKYFQSGIKYISKKKMEEIMEELKTFSESNKLAEMKKEERTKILEKYCDMQIVASDIIKKRKCKKDTGMRHQKTSRVVSIVPEKTNPDGTLFRVQRKDHKGNAIFQIITKNESFCGKIKGKNILSKDLCKHKNIVPIKIEDCCPYPTDRVLTDDEKFDTKYIEKTIPQRLKHIIKYLEYSTKGKGYIRLYMSMDNFKKFYEERAKEKEEKLKEKKEECKDITHYTLPKNFNIMKNEFFKFFDYENENEKNKVLCKVESSKTLVQITIENRESILEPFEIKKG